MSREELIEETMRRYTERCERDGKPVPTDLRERAEAEIDKMRREMKLHGEAERRYRERFQVVQDEDRIILQELRPAWFTESEHKTIKDAERRIDKLVAKIFGFKK